MFVWDVLYVVYIWQEGFPHALRGVSGVASFITIILTAESEVLMMAIILEFGFCSSHQRKVS